MAVSPTLKPPTPETPAVDGNKLTAPFLQWFDRLWKAQRFAAEFTLDPAAISAGNTNEETVTVPGLTTDMIPVVSKPSHTTGLVVGDAYVSAANTLKIRLANVSGSAVDAGEETWRVAAWRK